MGEVIVITSGKGGVGKTTTTANIGIGLASKGKKVVKAQGCCEGGCASCGGCDGHVFPTGQEKE